MIAQLHRLQKLYKEGMTMKKILSLILSLVLALSLVATLNVSAEMKAVIDEVLADKVNQWLIVSKVSFSEETLTQYTTVQVNVEKCAGTVCPRCWNITESTHEDGLCARCAEVLK